MSRRITLDDTADMTPAEKLELAHQLWDSVASDTEQVPVLEHERRLARERLAAYRKNPSATIPWEEIRHRIMGE